MCCVQSNNSKRRAAACHPFNPRRLGITGNVKEEQRQRNNKRSLTTVSDEAVYKESSIEEEVESLQRLHVANPRERAEAGQKSISQSNYFRLRKLSISRRRHDLCWIFRGL